MATDSAVIARVAPRAARMFNHMTITRTSFTYVTNVIVSNPVSPLLLSMLTRMADNMSQTSGLEEIQTFDKKATGGDLGTN